MRVIIKKFLTHTLHFSGVNWLIGKFNSSKVFCIGYHSIWDQSNKDELSYKLYKNISVSSNDFEKQLLFLKNNGHTFIRFVDLKKDETKKLLKPTIIFFDDGFRDVLKNALPVLKKYNVPATIFITAGLANQTHFLWTLGVRSFLFKQGKSEESIEKTIAELKKLRMMDREKEIVKMFSSANFILNPADFKVFLNWEEIKTLSQSGFEIGSHGIKHEKLTELSQRGLIEELVGSKKILEDKTGLKIEVLSYPYGRHDKFVIEGAIQAGYTIGVSTMDGNNSFDYIKNHTFEIKRVAPDEDGSLIDFKVRLYTNI